MAHAAKLTSFCLFHTMKVKSTSWYKGGGSVRSQLSALLKLEVKFLDLIGFERRWLLVSIFVQTRARTFANPATPQGSMSDLISQKKCDLSYWKLVIYLRQKQIKT